MTDNAYIVANKKQELDVLKKFERNDLIWLSGDNATEWVLSEESLFNSHASFPYALIEKDNNKIAWRAMEQLTNETIVYDGRKEENMYKVTQEFMDKLIEWRDRNYIDAKTGNYDAFIDGGDISLLNGIVSSWWIDNDEPTENNKRLIAIIQWINGEDVFEVEAPHKFIVRSDVPDEDGDYWYVNMHRDMFSLRYQFGSATRFNTREEAQEWANSHQVVVEIDEEGNEVE